MAGWGEFEVKLDGLIQVRHMLDPDRFGRAYVDGLRASATDARDRVRSEARKHVRFTGRMGEAPRHKILPSGIEASRGRALFRAVGYVDPGYGGQTGSPESYILSKGIGSMKRDSRYPWRVGKVKLANWAAARGLTPSVAVGVTGGARYGNRVRFGSRSNRDAAQRVAHAIYKAQRQRRAFNMTTGKIDNFWMRAISPIHADMVRDQVSRRMDAAA